MFSLKVHLLLKCLLVVAGLRLAQSQTSFTCVKDGMFAYNSCTQYVQCVYTSTVYAYKVAFTCPSGTLFDSNLRVCNWANQVTCSSSPIPAPTASPTQSPAGFTCARDGMFSINSCTQYAQCVYTNTVYAYKVVYTCPRGTLFDNTLLVCNWASNVACNGQIATTRPSVRTTTKGLR